MPGSARMKSLVHIILFDTDQRKELYNIVMEVFDAQYSFDTDQIPIKE